MSKLADFNFEIIHKPGATNQADALSQHPAIPKEENKNEDVIVLPDKLFVQAIEVATIETQVWEAQQKYDTTIKKWIDKYQLEQDNEGWWWKADAPVIPEDNQLRKDILWCYHNHPLAEHLGIANTAVEIFQNFWWPDLKGTVTQYVKGCATCQSTKPLTHCPKPLITPIEP
jgi:Integrase zinc binding domain